MTGAQQPVSSISANISLVAARVLQILASVSALVFRSRAKRSHVRLIVQQRNHDRFWASCANSFIFLQIPQFDVLRRIQKQKGFSRPFANKNESYLVESVAE